LIAAFFGAFVKDSLKFLIVKKHGKKLLAKKPKLQSKLDKASGWFYKRPLLYMSAYRLMYGFGTVIIMLSGLKDNVSYARFAIHSAISIGLWIILIGGFGFFCAEMMIDKLNFVSDHSLEVIGTLVVIGLVYWFFVKKPREKHCYTPIESA